LGAQESDSQVRLDALKRIIESQVYLAVNANISYESSNCMTLFERKIVFAMANRIVKERLKAQYEAAGERAVNIDAMEDGVVGSARIVR
jgi:hypothetical protein